MSHNLEIQEGKASMMYVGEAPWHGLGTRLDKPATAAEALKAARLNWKVQKAPLYARKSKGSVRVPGKFAVVREDSWGCAQNTVLGIVGSDYKPLQNEQAFEFFDPIVGKDAAVYHTAGALGDGERIWILAKLPDSIRVAGDDITDKYLLLSNSHDGSSAVQVKFTPIRVVCENTLTMALSRGPTIRVAHTRDLESRLREAEKLLGIISVHFDEIGELFQQMVRAPVGKERLKEYLAEVFPNPRNARSEWTLRRVQDNRAFAEYFFDQGKGNRAPRVKGTLWAAYNGVTELIDHRANRSMNDKHLKSVWFGTGYLIKARAFEVAKEKLAVWLN